MFLFDKSNKLFNFFNMFNFPLFIFTTSILSWLPGNYAPKPVVSLPTQKTVISSPAPTKPVVTLPTTLNSLPINKPELPPDYKPQPVCTFNCNPSTITKIIPPDYKFIPVVTF